MASTESIRNIQRLIWLYFWLLIFEGALRKWVVPQLATPLLIIRDPVAVGAYILAWKAEIFPKDIFTKTIIYLGFMSFLGGLATVVISDSNLKVAIILYGLRTNFLHLPLIFLIPKVCNLDDIKKLGRWILLLAVPIAILMAYQFNSSPEHFINRGASMGAEQIASAGGKIRPAGTFSFITGAAQYLALVASFLLYGLFQSKIYPYWLLIASGLSLVLGLAVSSSRTALGLVGGVLLCLVVALLVRPKLIGQSYKLLFLVCLVGFGTTLIPSFSEGVEIFNERVEGANSVEAGSGGIVGRFLSDFLKPFNHNDLPILGYGLGMGTNAGAALLTGKAQFLLAEGEWERVLFESGFTLGLLYLLMRIGIVVWMGALCVRSAIAGNVLPTLLFGACALNILNGQFGQPTTLGFAVLVGGLCIASSQVLSPSQAISVSNASSTNRKLLA